MLCCTLLSCAVLLCAQAHPQSIYYSLRTFVLSLRESAGRALAEYSRSKQAAEAGLKAALEAAGGDETSECFEGVSGVGHEC